VYVSVAFVVIRRALVYPGQWSASPRRILSQNRPLGKGAA